MQKQKGMGRTRLGRFAAITVPAGVAAAGMGYAILQGMVGATLSSADGFSLQSPQITSSSLALRAGSTTEANATDGTAVKTIYAQTGTTTNAKGLTIDAPVPAVLNAIFGVSKLEISSTDPTVALGKTILNAKDLTVTDPDAADQTGAAADATNSAASLTGVAVGVDQGEVAFDDTTTGTGSTGYDPTGFALTSGAATLNKVNATAYQISLASLNLDNLSIGFTN